jgi:hypothetical protein
MVASGQQPEAQRSGTIHETTELDMTIALDARVRGPAGRMVGHIWAHDHRIKVITQVEDVVVDAEGVGHTSRIIHVRHGTAA